MGLNDRMEHFASQFTGTARFGVSVLFYKGDNKATEQVVDVIWDADALPGTNEVDGDGVVLDKRSGRSTRQSIHIECSSSLDVDEHADPPDRFVKGEEVALVKRIVGKDAGGMMLLLCIRKQVKYDRGRYRMG